MSRLSSLKPNQVKVRLEDFVHIFMGEKKTGKSTLFRDLIYKHYNGDMTKGILFAFEPGAQALDGLFSPEVQDWEDWEEWVDDLVENKAKVTFRFVCIDTIDEMVAMAIDKTKRDSKKKDGKKVDSINEAFSGYGRGKEYCIRLMRDSILKLKRSGYGIAMIGHTKLKKKNTGTTLSTDEEYMQLSCNLTDDYAGLFENMADMITYLVIDKKVIGNVDDVKKKTAKNIVELHFRSDGAIDCGSRFKDLPHKLPYSAENYLLAFEQGVRSSMLSPVTESEIKEMAIQQEKEANVKAEKNKKLAIKQMIDKIKKEFANLGEGAKLALQKLIEDSQIESLDQLTEEDRPIVEKMYDLVV